MREDPTKTDSFKDDSLWNNQKYENKVMVQSEMDPDSRIKQKWGFTSNSLSGRERNRMFLRHGKNFSDVTLVSGADDLADGRSFALLDFDQDGWQDIAMMSLNAPRFKLYRNEMQEFFPDNGSFRFQLVGGHTGSSATENLSNRDGIGARALLTFKSGKKIMIQKQAGEGFASQNSDKLMIGIPQGDEVARMDVRWPSGIESHLDRPSNSELVIVREVQE